MPQNKKFKTPAPPVAVAGGALRVSTDDDHPVFCLRHLQRGHHLHDCTTEERASLAMRLYRLGQLTWKDLRQQHKHKLGFETLPVGSLRRTPPSPFDTVDVVQAFRFYNLAPMVGVKAGATFHILWLDRAFTLYDHG